MESNNCIHRHSAPEDKIALFRSLFRGREDVYPRRFESRRTGKTGYSPVCAIRRRLRAPSSRRWNWSCAKAAVPLSDPYVLDPRFLTHGFRMAFAAPPTQSATSSSPASGSTRYTDYPMAMAVTTTIFFMWGFLTVLNDILIPHLKTVFELNYAQAMLVQFAFFGAYGIGSLVYYIISMVSGDPINRIGYKNGVIIGLLITACGCLLFYPAAVLVSYPFFLLGLFVIGLGLAMLQIAANPYVTILGPERTASSRLENVAVCAVRRAPARTITARTASGARSNATRDPRDRVHRRAAPPTRGVNAPRCRGRPIRARSG